MEIDPSSMGDVGGSGDALLEQPVIAVPVDNQDAVVELLKKEKAELDNEIFTVKAKLEVVTTNLLVAQSFNEKVKEEKDSLARQFEERQRLFRELQVSNEDLLKDKLALNGECVNLKRERDEKELLLKRSNKEKQLIAVEVQSLRAQLKDLSAQKRELEMQRRGMEKAQQDAKLEMQRSMDEKAVYEESKSWFMKELSDRDNTIARMRLEYSGKEVSWQNERMRLIDEKNYAVNEVEDIKMDVALKQRVIDDYNEKVKGISETHEAQLATLKDEMMAKECLNRTLKDQNERADEAAREMKSLYDSTLALLEASKEEIHLTKDRMEAQLEETTRVIEEREKLIAELKDELEKANDLLKNKHNLSISDEAIEELSPEAAAASRLMKSGGSLTAIYREHVRLVGQLEEERARSRITETSFQEVIGQLTERAPQLIQQKEQLEKYMDENYRLENQLRDADLQRRQLMEERDLASRELAFSKAELEKEQSEKNILVNTMNGLVFELEKARELQEMKGWMGMEDGGEEDGRKIRDIKSLTRRNLELEMMLNSQKEDSHQLADLAVNRATERLEMDRKEMARDLEMMKNQCIKLENALAGKQQALESYKNIVEGGGLGGENSIMKRQLEQKAAELNEAKVKIARLDEWNSSEKESREKLVEVYEDRISKHMDIVSETKRANAKMESELELQKQTAMETYKELEKKTRQMERVVESEQKAKEKVLAVEHKVSDLHEKLLEMQREVSTLRVERRNLDEQLKNSQMAEGRLRAELNAREANTTHNEQMLALMEDMKCRVYAVESSKKEVMEMRVESLEMERDQLKTSNAVLAERNERIERDKGADIAKLSGEKADLEAKLQMEKNERISAENMANELREKLISSQKQFNTVDASIGSNPERLAQECQKLKNENKFMEGQMEELKKRLEVADAAARKAEEELNKLSALSSTVESTLIDTRNAGSLETERLRGLLEAETIKANTLVEEVRALKEEIATLEKSMRDARENSHNTILDLTQKMAVVEMHLREESAKGAVFDEKMRTVNEDKAALQGQISALSEELLGVRGEMEEMKIEKDAAVERVAELEAAMASLETRAREDGLGWTEERMRLEGEVKRWEMEMEGEKRRMEEEMKRKEEQIEQIMSSAHEMDTSSSPMEVEGMPALSAVNRYLREEKQRAIERMMRAEVDMKRVKVLNDELEGEKAKLERRVFELESKTEADAVALRDMAELKTKLELSVKIEKELGWMKEEKERIGKRMGEAERKVSSLEGEKGRLMADLKGRETIIAEKTREGTALKKTIGEKEAELAKLRTELAAVAKKSAEGGQMVGGPRANAMMTQLRGQLENSVKELNTTKEGHKKEVEALNAKITQLRTIALRYKNQIGGEGGSTSEIMDNQSISSDQGIATPPTSTAMRRIQEEKEAAEARVKSLEEEKGMVESERDEIQFRLKSINSMLDKTKAAKENLARENGELRRRLEELGVEIESQPALGGSQPVSASPSPMKTLSSLSNQSVLSSQGEQAPPPPPTQPGQEEESVNQSSSLESAASAAPAASSSSLTAAPSDPAPPAPTASNMFGSGSIDWPDKMSRTMPSSSSSTLATRGSLFGGSRTAHVSTSSSIPEDGGKGEDEQQPITSSSSLMGGESRKRGASEGMGEMKRARVEEEEEEGGNEAISSSHRGNEMEELMVEDDTRDGEGEEEEKEEEGERRDEEEEEEEVVEAREVEAEDGSPDEIVNVDDDEEGEEEEEESDRDEEVEELEEEEEGARVEEGVDEDDEVEVVSDEEEEEGEMEDIGSESDGEVEGEGEEEGEEREEEGGEEGREAVASIDEADDEERVEGGEGEVAVTVREEGEKKKKSPIRWGGAEQEECSSSNESGRPSTSSAAAAAGRGRGGAGGGRGRGGRARERDLAGALATNLMRMNRGGGKRRGGGGGGGARM